ncbi:MAG: hypothetical protein N2544_00060 [Burkholderiales bacterium]|nr:hypothetical protein [Burkholderiales bacterium]
MGMKRTEMEKHKAKALENRMRREAPGARPGASAAGVEGRRERRERERALGLVPFAVKLDAALVAEVRARAASRGGDLDAVVAELLRDGLAKP